MKFKAGHIPWNKGLTKDDDARISRCGFQQGRIPWNKNLHMWDKRPHPRGMLGKTAWNKGRHCPQKIKQKISESLKGHKGLTGEDNPMYGKSHSEEVRRKISKSLKRAYKEGRCVAWLKGGHHSKEEKEKISEGVKKAIEEERLKVPPDGCQSEEARKERGRSLIGNKYRVGKIPWIKGRTKETEPKVAEIAKKLSEGSSSFFKLHKDPEFERQRLRGLLKRPTKPERRVIQIIKRSDLPYRYVGDGKVIIERKCPDFINNNGAKRIIEVFGDHWHQPEEEQERKSVFAKYGFETLILWESQINTMPDSEIAEVIRTFEVT